MWAWSHGGGVWRTGGGGRNKHANRKPVKLGTSPSRRRSLHPVEALGGAEDLEGGEQRSQIGHHKRHEEDSTCLQMSRGC